MIILNDFTMFLLQQNVLKKHFLDSDLVWEGLKILKISVWLTILSDNS